MKIVNCVSDKMLCELINDHELEKGDMIKGIENVTAIIVDKEDIDTNDFDAIEDCESSYEEIFDSIDIKIIKEKVMINDFDEEFPAIIGEIYINNVKQFPNSYAIIESLA